jgi:pimeloyl-ACP methyl ester carboxylesterase
MVSVGTLVRPQRAGVRRHVASTVDRTFARAILKYGGRDAAERYAADERIAQLEANVHLFDDPRLVEDPSAFFMPSVAPRDVRERVRSKRGDNLVVDVTWASDYDPYVRAPEIRERYERHGLNERAHARVWRKRGGNRPAVVLLHGYLGGVHMFERYIWPVRSFLRRGFDVALFVLPFHGVRGAIRRGGMPAFPSSDPRFNIEGFRQAIHDLRTFVRWLDQRGATTVGVMGMSLGGYTSALLSTVEPRLGFVVPVIPLVSVPAFARERGRLNGTPSQQQRQYELLERMYRPVSPVARPSVVDRAGRLVIAGAADRITPVSEAERLAAHFDAPLETFPGSHLVHLGRRGAFTAIHRMWSDIGVPGARL